MIHPPLAPAMGVTPVISPKLLPKPGRSQVCVLSASFSLLIFTPDMALIDRITAEHDPKKGFGMYTFSRCPLVDSSLSGLYQRHPLFNITGVNHDLLAPYDKKQNPGCEDIPWNHLEFLDTGVGSGIRDLNSTLGIPPSTMSLLRRSHRECSTCKCV